MKRLLGCLLILGTLLGGSVAAQDKILRMPVTTVPPSLGNPFAANGLPSNFVWAALFDPLVRVSPSGRAEPGLAVDWEPLSPNRWRFSLRDGVTFSNGEQLTATGVKVTFDYLLSDEGRRMIVANELANIVAVTVIDPLTLEIETERPDAILPKRVTSAYIVAPEAWTTLGVDGFAQKPAGTGPFVLENWSGRDGRTRASAHRASWRAPLIDGIDFFELPDQTARVQSLLSGQLDVLVQVPPDVVEQVQSAGFETVTTPTPQVFAFAFNVTGAPDAPTADVRVRQALNYAVNKQVIADIITYGFYEPASQGATPVTAGYNPDLPPYSYDPVRAKALLSEAGYPDGFELDATAVVGSMAGDTAIYALVQQDLRAIGVTLNLRGTVFPDWLGKYLSNSWSDEMFGLSWNGSPPYDATRAMEYHSCIKAVPFFCDEDLTAGLNRVNEIFDPAEREQQLRKLAAEFRTAAPSLFLLEIHDIAAVAPRVMNFKSNTRVPVYEELDLKIQ